MNMVYCVILSVLLNAKLRVKWWPDSNPTLTLKLNRYNYAAKNTDSVAVNVPTAALALSPMVTSVVAVVADNKLASQLAAARVSQLKQRHRNAVRRHEQVLARQTVADRHWEAKRLPMPTSKDVAAVSARTHPAQFTPGVLHFRVK
jgi:hypothetical protein